MKYQIYKITNLINNKIYIGQTKKSIGYKKRFENHCRDAIWCNQKYPSKLCVFHKAIIKYGADNFKLELIADDIEEDNIDDLEKYYIKYYNSFFKNNKGYNMTWGGQGIHGYQHTDEVKSILGHNSKKYWDNLRENDIAEYIRVCELRSIKLKGKPKTDEAKKHYKEAARRNVSRPDYINPFKGKHHTEQTKRIVALKNGIRIGMFDKENLELIKIFDTTQDAVNYLIQNKLTSNKWAKSRILHVCEKSPHEVAYGYRWKIMEGVSTIGDEFNQVG